VWREPAVATEIKFCGMTRPSDASHAASLGAAYVGAIFAGGPRMIAPEQAASVFATLPAALRRVGVFASQDAEEIARIVRIASLDIVQLHGESNVERIEAVRARTGAEIWSVVRVEGTRLPDGIEEIALASDGLLLDAHVAGMLGGTGVTLPWGELAGAIDSLRSDTRFILAGGLTSENVSQAIAALSPDVVDVSSGVEDGPGLKNHDRMRAFRDAVAHASIPT
jgi:phosphoribosylanthranilate isomerase